MVGQIEGGGSCYWGVRLWGAVLLQWSGGGWRHLASVDHLLSLATSWVPLSSVVTVDPGKRVGLGGHHRLCIVEIEYLCSLRVLKIAVRRSEWILHQA